MQILTHKALVPHAQKAVAAPAAEAGQTPTRPTVHKPLTESWTIDGANGASDTFSSTADLLARAGDLDKVSATYSYTTAESAAPFNSGEKIKNAVGAGLGGAVAGAVGGAVLGAVGSFLGEVGDLFGAFLGGNPSSSSSSLLGPVLVGASIGLVWSAIDGYQVDNQTAVEKVTGKLVKTGDKAAFYPGGNLDKEVDLKSYQDAPVAPVVEGRQPEPQNALKNTLKGAGIGAACALPLVSYVLPTVAGVRAGQVLGDGRTSLGAGVGVIAGAAATVGGIMAWSQLGVTGGLIAAGGLALTGAALGHKYFSEKAKQEAAPARDFGQQWWTNQGQSY